MLVGRVGWTVVIILLGMAGCSEPAGPAGDPESGTDPAVVPLEASTAETPAADAPPPEPASSERNAYFGDLHVHTGFSFDAFIFGTRATPDDAYRFAKGESISHPGGFDVQLRAPLDFQAVTDHAAYLGMLPEMDDPTTKAGQHPGGQGGSGCLYGGRAARGVCLSRAIISAV